MILNKKAKFEYEFMDKYEAGIMLTGPDVKAIRSGKLSLIDAYCIFNGNELFMNDKKLLLKRRELSKLQKSLIKGLAIIPYKIFENNRGIFKMEVYLAKGKKLYDKRETIKQRDILRDSERNIL
jgi:SsrA-binding protein